MSWRLDEDSSSYIQHPLQSEGLHVSRHLSRESKPKLARFQDNGRKGSCVYHLVWSVPKH